MLSESVLYKQTLGATVSANSEGRVRPGRPAWPDRSRRPPPAYSPSRAKSSPAPDLSMAIICSSGSGRLK